MALMHDPASDMSRHSNSDTPISPCSLWRVCSQPSAAMLHPTIAHALNPYCCCLSLPHPAPTFSLFAFSLRSHSVTRRPSLLSPHRMPASSIADYKLRIPNWLVASSGNTHKGQRQGAAKAFSHKDSACLRRRCDASVF
jgi:hypothetical protein